MCAEYSWRSGRYTAYVRKIQHLLPLLNYRCWSRLEEDSRAVMKLRAFRSGWGGWSGFMSGASLGCNWFIYRMRNTRINLLETERASLAVVQISSGQEIWMQEDTEVLMSTLAALKSSSRTSDNVGCAWTASLMSCMAETIICWVHQIVATYMWYYLRNVDAKLIRLNCQQHSLADEFLGRWHSTPHGWDQQHANPKCEPQEFHPCPAGKSTIERSTYCQVHWMQTWEAQGQILDKLDLPLQFHLLHFLPKL